MNPYAMPNPNRPFIARFAPTAALAAGLLLAACGEQAAQSPQPPLKSAPLYGSAIKGGFELTDENGAPRTWEDYAGKWRVVYFGYAYCPDYCPTDVSRFSRGIKLYAKDHPDLAATIQPLFVSVDPERDTPEVLREFTDNFDPNLIGLSGTPEQLEQAAKNFFVQYGRGEESEGGGYLMDHTTITYLFSPDGEAIATLPTDDGPEAVAAELAKWVR